MNLRFAICDLRFLPAAAWLAAGAKVIAQPGAKPGDDIPPLAPPLPEIQPPFWEQHGWLVLAGAGVVGIVLAIVLWLVLRPKPVSPVPPEVRARAELDTLLVGPETGEVLSRVSQSLRRYLAAVFALPPGEMNTTEFGAALQGHAQIGPELSAALVEFLRSCDERKFSPAASPTPLGAARRARALVDMAEARRAKLREPAQAEQNP